jgi:phosphoribosylglycinamide formyltransferase-1
VTPERAPTKTRVAILISGRGSNMMALVEAMAAAEYPALPAVVISNRPEAAGISWAAERGVPTVIVDHTMFANRMVFEARLHQALIEHGTEIICNAGFMRILTGGFVERWRDRQLNIHPSLLPLFPGLDTHQRVLDHGALITGCTVHIVRTEMDSGPIIAQAAVPVLPGDDVESLAARVLAAEHQLYPHALAMIATGRVRIKNDAVVFADAHAASAPLFAPRLPRGGGSIGLGLQHAQLE